MMQTENFQIVTNGDMSADVTSSYIMLTRDWGFSIQAVWTGTPTGALTIEVSNDVGTNQFGAGVTHWDTYVGSSTAIAGSAGSFTYNVSDVAFKWARLKYTRASSSGTLNARINVKGV